MKQKKSQPIETFSTKVWLIVREMNNSSIMTLLVAISVLVNTERRQTLSAAQSVTECL